MFLRRIFKDRVFVLIGGTGLAQLIGFAIMPIVSRFYLPVDYAKYSYFFSLFSFFSAIGTLNYEFAIVSKLEIGEDHKLLRLCFYLSLSSAMIFSVVYYFGSTLLFLQNQELPMLSSFIMLGILILSYNINSWRFFNIRQEDYKSISYNRVAQAVSKAVSLLLFGVTKSGYIGLLVSEAVGFIFGSRSSIFLIMKNIGLHITLREVRFIAEKYRAFPLLVLPGTIMGLGGTSLTIPLMIWAFGLNEAGLFAFAQRIISIPSNLIGTSLADVFQKAASDNIAEGYKKMRQYLYISVPTLIIISVISYFTLPYIFGVLFGVKWTRSGILASLSTFWIGSQFISGIIGRVVYVINRQRRKLIQDGLNLLIVVGVIVGGRAYGWSIDNVLLLISALSAVVAFLYVSELLRYTRMELERDNFGNHDRI